MTIPILKDLNLQNKKVLMRVDFNVPIKDGLISDDTRIREALPSIKYVLDHEGIVILMSHLGRPKEKEAKFSLKPIAERLKDLLGQDVQFISDCIGPEVEEKVASLKPKDVLLLENLRFYPEEEKPDKNLEFAKNLAKLGDIYVNDAFGCAHRTHSSTVKVAEYFPRGAKAIGFLMEKEIEFLGNILKNPERPLYALIGGAKISSKIGVLLSLVDQVDAVFLGGAMVYTFMKAQGIECGKSLMEVDQVEKAKEIMKAFEDKNVSLYFPKDIITVDKISPDATIKVVNFSEGIDPEMEGVDIGPQTIQEYTEQFKKAKTILWNGPVGIFEVPPFDKGTNSLAEALANSKVTVVVGGGDSVAAIQKAGLQDKFAHLSTGGGASLEFIEFGTLPGIEILSH
jgi:phosphoglycerate kinase